MAVTQEQLAKVQAILEHLENTQDAEVENRRQAQRVAVQMGLDVIVLGHLNGSPVAIFTRNFSISGIGFVSRRLFKPQERIAISLRVANLSPKLILARVTFGRYAGGGYYEMGAEFLESIPDGAQVRIPSHWILATDSSAKSTAKAGA